jgi:hypothetical protein
MASEESYLPDVLEFMKRFLLAVGFQIDGDLVIEPSVEEVRKHFNLGEEEEVFND